MTLVTSNLLGDGPAWSPVPPSRNWRSRYPIEGSDPLVLRLRGRRGDRRQAEAL